MVPSEPPLPLVLAQARRGGGRRRDITALQEAVALGPATQSQKLYVACDAVVWGVLGSEHRLGELGSGAAEAVRVSDLGFGLLGHARRAGLFQNDPDTKHARGLGFNLGCRCSPWDVTTRHRGV
jgi:hypothetical protein